MLKRSHLGLILAAFTASAAGAQTPDWVNVLLDAARLPVSANAARNEGVPGNEVRTAIEAMQNKKLPAGEARAVLDEARNGVRAHGPVENFGAFVQSKLDAGLRGRQLAAAIRAEHVARGKGNAARGKSATKGQSDAKGQPAAKGKSAASDTKAKRPAKPRQEEN